MKKTLERFHYLWLLIGCLLLTGVMGVSSVLASPGRITQIKIHQLENRVEIMLQGTQTIQQHYFILTHPYRLVVDLSHVRYLALNSIPNIPNSLIKNFRKSKRPPGNLRLVFDLTKSVTVKVIHLSNKRLMIILSSKNSTTLHNHRAKSSSPVYSELEMRRPEPKKVYEMSPIQRDPNIIVVIDPGHGGKDPGATGIHGTREKNVVLKISRDLQRIINHQPGFRAVLTRSGDYYLTLRERLAIARQYKADVFIAIHADTYHNPNARGATVFALSERGETSEAARWLAMRENASELMGGVRLADKEEMLKSVLLNLSQTATIRASLEIGHDFLNSLSALTVLHHHRVEQAAFVVLKSPDIPSLLVETGFLSNASEEKRLNNERYCYSLALAISSGLVRYFHTEPPPGTYLYQHK